MARKLSLADILELGDAGLEILARDEPEVFARVCQTVHEEWTRDINECQLAWYKTANPMALPAHLSRAREVALVGGNRSSKTDTMLAELSIQMTGHVPQSLVGVYPREKIRAPIRARVVVNDLGTTLEPIVKPKLQWDKWNGVGDPQDGMGHWGWVPKHLLKGGTWENAYSEKYRTLNVAVDNYWVGSGGTSVSTRGFSSCQFMSYDQELSAFAGSSMHFIGHDELPPSTIYRENRIRTLDVKGQIYTAFTPPDEIGASHGDVSWFFNEVYEKGLPGPGRDPTIESIILHTERNTILAREDVAEMARKMTDAQREVRLLGRFIHLSGVIFPLFTQHEQQWCYRCGKKTLAVEGHCPSCTSDDVGAFIHVMEPFPIPHHWPVIFAIDPHPRKPDVMTWTAVAPSDDLFTIGELEIEGTADDIRRAVDLFESSNRINPVKRIMDPNIALETNDKLRRGWTLRQSYDEAGLRCDLANDDMNVGIAEVQDALKPDSRTRAPKWRVFNTCPRLIKAMSRWAWMEYAKSSEHEAKERPRDLYKDPVDCLRYTIMDRPTYGKYAMTGVRPSYSYAGQKYRSRG